MHLEHRTYYAFNMNVYMSSYMTTTMRKKQLFNWFIHHPTATPLKKPWFLPLFRSKKLNAWYKYSHIRIVDMIRRTTMWLFLTSFWTLNANIKLLWCFVTVKPYTRTQHESGRNSSNKWYQHIDDPEEKKKSKYGPLRKLRKL